MDNKTKYLYSFCMMIQKEKNLGYHISKGADDIYWILNNGENFIKNLSKNFDSAVIKAKEYVGSNVDTSVWHRRKKFYDTDCYAKKPEQQDSHVDSHYSYLDNIEFQIKKIQCEAREYVGDVGNTLEMELELIETFSFDGEWGNCSCYRFKDSNENRFVYFGTSVSAECFKNSGDKFVISFEIKKQFIDQQHYEKDGVVPFKVNQISKIKNNLVKTKNYWVSLPSSDEIIDIDVLYTPSKNKKDVRFDFSFKNRQKEKIVFYPTGIKTFKQAKEFLHKLSEFNDKGKLTVEYLTNLTKETK